MLIGTFICIDYNCNATNKKNNNKKTLPGSDTEEKNPSHMENVMHVTHKVFLENIL